MLTAVFGCQGYIWEESTVTVQKDHKQLEAIMKKPLQNTPSRFQRLILSLQGIMTIWCI